MGILKELNNIVSSPSIIIYKIVRSKFGNNFLSDETAISILYQLRFRRPLNLKNPTTFNEKLLWLTLNDRDPIYTKMVDKYNAKFYIDSKIGEGYTVPSLGVWKNTSEIDFKSLPSSFVLKCNHDSGSVIICENRLPTEFELKQLDKAICKNYYWFSREWPYKNVKPLIFAEKYIECKSSDSGGLHDYKFYCFNGIPQLVCVISDRAQKAKLTFIDLNWNILPFKQRYPNHDIIPKKPLNFDTMLRLSKILSKNIPFLRVDFFEDKNNRLYIGELTFTPSSGLIPFEPEQYDLFYGNLLNIKDN